MRLSVILLAAALAAAPMGAAAAQERGPRGDRDRGSASVGPRQISVSEAQGIARSRAGGAAFVGYVGMRGDSYVFRFERNGQVFDVAVSIYGR